MPVEAVQQSVCVRAKAWYCNACAYGICNMNLLDTAVHLLDAAVYDSREHTCYDGEETGKRTGISLSTMPTATKVPTDGAMLGTYPKRLVFDHSQ